MTNYDCGKQNIFMDTATPHGFLIRLPTYREKSLRHLRYRKTCDINLQAYLFIYSTESGLRGNKEMNETAVLVVIVPMNGPE
jgi:hypothetical protein